MMEIRYAISPVPLSAMNTQRLAVAGMILMLAIPSGAKGQSAGRQTAEVDGLNSRCFVAAKGAVH